MIKILCIIDLRENTHYSLERAPAIKRALKKNQVSYVCIYEFVKLFGSIQSANEVNFLFSNYVLSNKIERIFTSSELFEFISADTFYYLTQRGVVISCVLGDDENNYDININYLGVITIPIAYQKKQFEGYRLTNLNTYHLPISVSFKDTKRYLTVKKEIDVLFIGRPYANRVSLLSFLHKSGEKINIYGSSEWSKYFDSSVYKGFVDNDVYYQTVAKAKVYLAFLESPKNTKLLHINAKPFDAAKANSALVVTRYEKFAQDYGLVEGDDYFAYQSEQELVYKINLLLSNDEVRDRLTINLRRKLKAFDYDQSYQRYFNKLLSFEGHSVPEVIQARVKFVEKFDRNLGHQLKGYDFIIFNNSRHIKYAKTLSRVLSAHLNSKRFIKIDSTYNGAVARKVFRLIDLPSLAIPIDRLKEVRVILGMVYLCDARQTFIPLNNYSKFSPFISFLILTRNLYKRLVR